MHRSGAGLLVFLTVLLAAHALRAQGLDCSGGCTTTKSGLSHPDDFDCRVPLIPDPADPGGRPIVDPIAFDHDDLRGSYLYSRTPLTNPNGLPCRPERSFQPILLRERTGCLPTSEGPTDVANGGTAGGCSVEIPQGLSPGYENRSKRAMGPATELIGATGSAGPYSASTASFSSSSTDQVGQSCRASNVHAPTTGLRYGLPASRGGNGTKTYIEWTENTINGLYGCAGEASRLCCQATPDTFCGTSRASPSSWFPGRITVCAGTAA